MNPKDEIEKSKNELMGMIAHKVHTHLVIIKEGLSLVLDEMPGRLNPEQQKILTTVKNNADRLIQSVEEILKTASDKLRYF